MSRREPMPASASTLCSFSDCAFSACLAARRPRSSNSRGSATSAIAAGLMSSPSPARGSGGASGAAALIGALVEGLVGALAGAPRSASPPRPPRPRRRRPCGLRCRFSPSPPASGSRPGATATLPLTSSSRASSALSSRGAARSGWAGRHTVVVGVVVVVGIRGGAHRDRIQAGVAAERVGGGAESAVYSASAAAIAGDDGSASASAGFSAAPRRHAWPRQIEVRIQEQQSRPLLGPEVRQASAS